MEFIFTFSSLCSFLGSAFWLHCNIQYIEYTAPAAKGHEAVWINARKLRDRDAVCWKKPEDYRGLLVRVVGYFIDLDLCEKIGDSGILED